MSWPNNTGIETTHLNEDSDSPAEARPALYAALKALLRIITARGNAEGIASLDAAGKVPLSELRINEPNGLATLDAQGVVPANLGALPLVGGGLTSASGRLVVNLASSDSGGLWLNGDYLDHADTSTQPSSINSDGDVVRAINLDDYGHITSISTATVTTLGPPVWSTWKTYRTSEGRFSNSGMLGYIFGVILSEFLGDSTSKTLCGMQVRSIGYKTVRICTRDILST